MQWVFGPIENNKCAENIVKTLFKNFYDEIVPHKDFSTRYDIFNTYNLIYCRKYLQAYYFKLAGKYPSLFVNISGKKDVINWTSIINTLFGDIINCEIGGIANLSKCVPKNVKLTCDTKGNPTELLEFNKNILNYNCLKQ